MREIAREREPERERAGSREGIKAPVQARLGYGDKEFSRKGV